jgi:hypothetical protein
MAATILNDGYRHHIGLRPYCGICGSVMIVGERFVACEFEPIPNTRLAPIAFQTANERSPVLGNRNSTSYLCQTDSSIFPDYGHNFRRVNNISLCRRPDCRQCAGSSEAATIHSDCLQLFARECKVKDALDRLWTTAAWRSPWRQAPHLRLADTHVMPDISAVEAFGLPE